MSLEAPARAPLLEAALACFAAEGFEATTMAHIAARAGVPLEAAFLCYPSKHAFALALYQAIVSEPGGGSRLSFCGCVHQVCWHPSPIRCR